MRPPRSNSILHQSNRLRSSSTLGTAANPHGWIQARRRRSQSFINTPSSPSTVTSSSLLWLTPHDRCSSAVATATPNGHGTLTLRPATMEDARLLERWDEQDYLKAIGGDEDWNDWEWSKELARGDEETASWRQYLMADVSNDSNNPTSSEDDRFHETTTAITTIGFVSIIDPAKEETHYWGTDCEPNLRAIDIWIGEPTWLGKGWGSRMMEQVLKQYCFGEQNEQKCMDLDVDSASDEVDGAAYSSTDSKASSSSSHHEPILSASSDVMAVLVDPMADNIKAHKFYQKFGFKPIGIRWFGPDKCLVHRLERSGWEERADSKFRIERSQHDSGALH